MVQGYYTLQEAADVVGMPVDELKQMAQRNQIRSFQDRGTLRFRIQDIQELQRQHLSNSDPELVLGDALSPQPKMRDGGPKSGSKTPKPHEAVADVFDFDLGDDTDIGREIPARGGSAARKKSVKSDGSDSDVKLVADGSESFSIRADDSRSSSGDSDVRLGDLDAKKSAGPSSRKSMSGARRQSKLGPAPADSGVRLVPMDSDSDVRIMGDAITDDAPTSTGSDSAIRLDKTAGHRAAENLLPTEEINLDGEFQFEAPATPQRKTKFKDKKSALHKGERKSEIKKPAESKKPSKVSPFELSDSDLDDAPKSGVKKKSDSSDFELTPAGKKRGNTDFELPGKDSDEDFSLELNDDALDLGASPGEDFEGPKSGINLGRPIDAGVSLEARGSDESSEMDFELNLEGAQQTPKPSKRQDADSDSEFELSLDDGGVEENETRTSESDFELALDEGTTEFSAKSDSDSEFELTLDDDSAKQGDVTEEKDVFETDFDLPSLEEGDEAETMDGGSSDFELALDDSDIASEDESASQVVALEEEGDYAEDAQETVTGEFDDVEVDDDDVEGEVREKVVVQEVVRERWLKPAPWGVLPVIFMLPCVVILLLVGIMGFELVQGSGNFKSSGLLTRSVAEMMGYKIR